MILIDLLPYILLLFLTLFIPKVSKKYMFLLFVIFLIFSGCRYGVGWDYFNYVTAMEEGGWRISRIEYLVRQLELFCYHYQIPQVFFFVTSFILLSCYFFVISKESYNPAISVFVFLCLPVFFLSSLSIIRFSLSVSIWFLAYYYLEKGEKWVYFALIFASFFVHRAAIFGLLTVPFVFGNLKFTKRTNIIIFIVCFVVGKVLGAFSIISAVLSPFLVFFQEEEFSITNYIVDSGGEGFSRTPYLYAVINLIVLLSSKELINSSKNEKMASHITLFNLGCSVMFLFSFSQTFASRLSQFFMLYLLFIVPYFKKNSIQKYMLVAILLFVFVFQLTNRGYHTDFMGRVNCFLPYRFFFTN